MVLESAFDATPRRAQHVDNSHRLFEDLFRDLVRPPGPEVRERTITGGDGVVRTIRTKEPRLNVYCRDDSGEWDSNDGHTWIRRGSRDMRRWNGSVRFDRSGSYITRGSDSGITHIVRTAGSSTKSITNSEGVVHEITYNRQGSPTRCQIGASMWTSADGGNSWSDSNGTVWRGKCGIDLYGQYYEQREGADRRIVAWSRELDEITRRQAQLTERFGVIFPRPGQTVVYDGRNYTARPPTQEELHVLERVLDRNGQLNMRNLQICFIQSPPEGGPYLWGYYSRRGNEGAPRLALMPRALQSVDGWNAMEGTLEHELVHHEQYERWGNNHWGAAAAPLFTRELLREMGWVFDPVSRQSRILDRDGNQWQHHTNSGRFQQVIDGHPEPGRNVSPAEMRQRAKVRPSSNYFTGPSEMHAEGMAMFRQSREMLFRESPQLYEIMRRWDQQLIDRQYGREGGQPRMIRAIDGRIVPNTAANKQAVSAAERAWRNRRPTPAPQSIPPDGLCEARSCGTACC